uniref:Polyprotein p42 n=1 Tax=Influenza C virus (strain C/Aichi/1/1981) TaxID=217167 RepID=Q67391_INCAI|nr:unspliced product of M gene [Influenza C virus (C/Aichi/1/81)]
MAHEILIAETEAFLKNVAPETRTAIISAITGGKSACKSAAKLIKNEHLPLMSGEATTMHIVMRCLYPEIKPWKKASDMLNKATSSLKKSEGRDIRKQMKAAGDFLGVESMMKMRAFRDDQIMEMVEEVYDHPDDYTPDIRIGTITAWLRCKNKKSERYRSNVSEGGRTALKIHEVRKASTAMNEIAGITGLGEEALSLQRQTESLAILCNHTFGSNIMRPHLEKAIKGVEGRVGEMGRMAMKWLVVIIYFSIASRPASACNLKTCLKLFNNTDAVTVHCFNENQGYMLTLASLGLGIITMLYLLVKIIIELVNGFVLGRWERWCGDIKTTIMPEIDSMEKDIALSRERLDLGEDAPDETDNSPIPFSNDGVFEI